MWHALVTMDYYTVKQVAFSMGIDEYYRYLPLLFTYRTINTTKPLGGKLAEEERKFIKENEEFDLDKVGVLL